MAGLRTTLLKHFEFSSAEVTALRKWHRLSHGTTITDARKLVQIFVDEAISNQWQRVEKETQAKERNA